MVLQALPEPLRVELAEGLREVRVPKGREERAGVVSADEVPQRHEGQGHPTLLQDVQPLRGVPTELPVLEQVGSAGVVLHVLHDNVLPGDGELVGPAVGNVGLPIARREGRSVDHVVQAIDVLDAEPGHGDAEEERRRPVGEKAEEDEGVEEHHGELCRKEQSEDLPKVQHIVIRHLRKEEFDGLMAQHLVLVGRGVHAPRLRAALSTAASASARNRGLGTVRLHGVGVSDVLVLQLLLEDLRAVLHGLLGLGRLQRLDVVIFAVEERDVRVLVLLRGLLQVGLPRLGCGPDVLALHLIVCVGVLEEEGPAALLLLRPAL
mmetsp:Transcript_8740/g.27847  ORF Transcript_8740/g.27847 Transcript_8740/m.27847 type:complete len:320 (-) Transcript_8740:167-1126(-)